MRALKKSSKIKGRASPKDPLARALLGLSIKLVTILIVVTAVFTFVFGLARIKDMGMVPNLAPGDLVIYYRLEKKYLVGDTLVYSYKGQKRSARVVALPGDKVDLDDSGLKVNGYNQNEPKVYKSTRAFRGGIKYPIRLREDEYFIMGDNRDAAGDSRLFGPMDKKDILGKIFALVRGRGI